MIGVSHYGYNRLHSFNPLLDHGLVHLLLCGTSVWQSPRTVKDFSNLLKTSTLGFREKQICDHQEHSQQTAKDNIILVANVLHANWVAKSGNDQGRVNCKELAGESLRSASSQHGDIQHAATGQWLT
jgi:hypothetical protein